MQLDDSKEFQNKIQASLKTQSSLKSKEFDETWCFRRVWRKFRASFRYSKMTFKQISGKIHKKIKIQMSYIEKSNPGILDGLAGHEHQAACLLHVRCPQHCSGVAMIASLTVHHRTRAAHDRHARCSTVVPALTIHLWMRSVAALGSTCGRCARASTACCARLPPVEAHSPIIRGFGWIVLLRLSFFAFLAMLPFDFGDEKEK